MSAFFLAINRDFSPFDRAIAQRMHEQLQRYGHDGDELIVQGHYALGYQRSWSVPEEIGERQPLYCEKSDLWLMLHGRLDNRSDLFALLSAELSTDVSDAALLMQLYHEFGNSIFADLVGPFVFVFFSVTDSRIIAARDCMGGRYLVSSIDTKLALFSTYEMALAAHPAIGYKINQLKAVKLLTHSMDGQPASMLKGLQPMLPGHQLSIDKGSLVTKPFYLPDPKRRIKFDHHQDYAEEFRRLLEQAVVRRLRTVGPVGTMLSGGFDSVPMSIVAAQQLGKASPDHERQNQLIAYSWAYDKHVSADEREFSVPVCDDFDIKPNWVMCDDVWPQFDASTACNPIIPFSTPYSAFNQALFQRAQQQGTRVLLSGMGGDMLYTGHEQLPTELLKKGRWRDAIREYLYAWKACGSGRRFISDYLLGSIRARTQVDNPVPQWLSESIQGWLKPERSWLATQQQKALRPQQYFNVVGSLEGEDMSYGRYFETDFNIERRYPFRDRDLAEFMLAIPTEQLFYDHYPRPIVRRAFSEELRPELRQRIAKTSFTSVIEAGIDMDQRYPQYLKAPNLASAEYVNICYLSAESPYFERFKHVPWRCAYYEFWKTSCYTAHANTLG